MRRWIKLGSQLIAMSFWNDENTQVLARSFGAVTLLDKMRLVDQLIPAIKAAAIKQRTASVTTLDKEGQCADT